MVKSSDVGRVKEPWVKSPEAAKVCRILHPLEKQENPVNNCSEGIKGG